MADRLLGFKVSTYIIVVFLPGSADSKIKQVIAVLILKTVTCVFVIIRSKFFRLLIPVINKPVGIVNPMLITETEENEARAKVPRTPVVVGSYNRLPYLQSFDS